MIDVATEHLLTLSQAAAMLPGRPSLCALWRWRTRGVRGRKLEAVTIGGRTYTSLEALQRFSEQNGGNDAPLLRTPAARERAIHAAERIATKAGF